jgi:hypothetical protein
MMDVREPAAAFVAFKRRACALTERHGRKRQVIVHDQRRSLRTESRIDRADRAA